MSGYGCGSRSCKRPCYWPCILSLPLQVPFLLKHQMSMKCTNRLPTIRTFSSSFFLPEPLHLKSIVRSIPRGAIYLFGVIFSSYSSFVLLFCLIDSFFNLIGRPDARRRLRFPPPIKRVFTSHDRHGGDANGKQYLIGPGLVHAHTPKHTAHPCISLTRIVLKDY